MATTTHIDVDLHAKDLQALIHVGALGVATMALDKKMATECMARILSCELSKTDCLDAIEKLAVAYNMGVRAARGEFDAH